MGIFPQGASPYGVFDMSGNVWEWCLNEYDDPEKIELSGGATRVVRGGSWGGSLGYARASSRLNDHYPNYRDLDYGFRLVVRPPSLRE